MTKQDDTLPSGGWDEFVDELKTMHNHIGIIGDHELCRLIGYHEDPQDRYYHIRRMWNSLEPKRIKGNNETYFSAVGAFVSLKGVIPKERYEAMDNIFKLNGSPPTDEFLISSSEEEPWITYK